MTPLATVQLPLAPITGSPVPHLTSIHSSPIRGSYGNARYPGNCSGNIIKDLLMYFIPHRVFDPMTGSGTCSDVCRELRIFCKSGDVKTGFDAADAKSYVGLEPFDFIWLHPPYWRMKIYSADPRCLSNAPDMGQFYIRLRQVIRNCKSVLAEHGKIAVLMGDYRDMGLRKMVPCTQMVREIALREKLWPACTEIVRFQHGNSSSQKAYASSFIPGLHDICLIYERAC
jgi:hypothetical protein